MNTRELIDKLNDAANHPGKYLDDVLMRWAASILHDCLAAGFVTEDGKVRKVLGTLPLTADGFLAGSAAELWWRDSEEERTRHIMVLPCNVSDCYSTPEACEAAEAAREVKHGE